MLSWVSAPLAEEFVVLGACLGVEMPESELDLDLDLELNLKLKLAGGVGCPCSETVKHTKGVSGTPGEILLPLGTHSEKGLSQSKLDLCTLQRQRMTGPPGVERT